MFPFPSSAKSRAAIGLEALAPFFGFLHQKKLQARQLVDMHRAKERKAGCGGVVFILQYKGQSRALLLLLLEQRGFVLLSGV